MLEFFDEYMEDLVLEDYGLTYYPPTFVEDPAAPIYQLTSDAYFTIFTSDRALDKSGSGNYKFNIIVLVTSVDSLIADHSQFDFDLEFKGNFC